jgi:hypothetical protein
MNGNIGSSYLKDEEDNKAKADASKEHVLLKPNKRKKREQTQKEKYTVKTIIHYVAYLIEACET